VGEGQEKRPPGGKWGGEKIIYPDLGGRGKKQEEEEGGVKKGEDELNNSTKLPQGEKRGTA